MSEEKDLYAVLNLKKNASEDEIKKAFRVAARKFHPDVNKEQGAEDKFKEIQEAHEVLSDPHKREIYDKYGMKGLKEGVPSQGGFDIFDIFSGRASGMGGQRGPQKSETVRQPLQVTLEELYNGATRKIRVTRTRNCSSCKGIGASSKDGVKKCSTCDGIGVVNRVVQLAPGFISQSRSPCPDCGGNGESIDKKLQCKDCLGKKVVSEKKTLEVHIEKGMKHNQKLVFEGEADEKPGVQPGDIVFILQEKEHATFQRDNNNLIIAQKISLREALTGCEFKVTHLDGRILLIKNKTGDVIKPGHIKQIENEGMPVAGNPFQKGSLFIKFEVEFPTKIPDELVANLKAILPPAQKADMKINPEDKDKIEEVEMHDADLSKKNNSSGSGNYDSDEEQESGGRSIPCATQ